MRRDETMWLLEELGTAWEQIAVILVTGVAIYAIAVVYIRIAGLRSMSKMSSFDFIMTVAAGAIVGSTALTTGSLAEGATALAVLFVLQIGIAFGRRNFGLRGAVDNTPLLLMHGEEILEEHLDRARITVEELHGKLREANVLHYSQVKAVVLETTGDVSVMHGDAELDPDLLFDVRGVDRLRAEHAE
jgi:uncharacterized membrane protein YcaP (DUF421 family)